MDLGLWNGSGQKRTGGPFDGVLSLLGREGLEQPLRVNRELLCVEARGSGRVD